MYREKRPTCVTVIGWAWIIIGGLMCFSAIMALISSIMMGMGAQDEPDLPLIFRLFPLIAIVQIGFAALGLISGIHFLKLRSWARHALEMLTWLCLLFLLAFMVYWVYEWLSMPSGGSTGFGILGAVMGVVITAIYTIPLGIMLKYLRGETVKNAIRTGLQSTPAEVSDQ